MSTQLLLPEIEKVPSWFTKSLLYKTVRRGTLVVVAGFSEPLALEHELTVHDKFVMLRTQTGEITEVPLGYIEGIDLSELY